MDDSDDISCFETQCSLLQDLIIDEDVATSHHTMKKITSISSYTDEVDIDAFAIAVADIGFYFVRIHKTENRVNREDRENREFRLICFMRCI